MIVTQTPLRFSLVGGGSDLPAFYRDRPGEVLSTSIDKYVYVTVNERFDESVRVSYSRTEEVGHAGLVCHPIVRAALDRLNIAGGVEITSIADIPSRGTGLGSSSAFAVGLLHALHAYQGSYRSKVQLAADACDLEINVLKEPIGKQDQYAAAMGGLNLIRFNSDESVEVNPVTARPETMRQIQQSMLMFYTGVSRSASDILKRQHADMSEDPGKRKTLGRMVDMVDILHKEIMMGNVNAVGEVLHESWLLKKSLTSAISNSSVDDAYDRARRAGAIGGKLLGAGGGGFFVFYADPEKHAAIRESLADLRCVPFRFEHLGTRVAFYQPSVNHKI
jgi:D-glycero-alpha-D-manno-heptose-7-phosphate kinase